MYSCIPLAFSIAATFLSVAIALQDSEPPGMCVHTNYDNVSEERSSDVGISNTLQHDRCV